MDAFDYHDTPETRLSRLDVLWNIMTLVILMSVFCVVGVFLLIFIDPSTGLNPFPPPTLPPTASLPTATPTSIVVLPPTWTPTDTPVPTLADTPIPTDTLPPTPTPITLTPTWTITVTKPPGGYPFSLQQGSPVAIPNIYHPELGCNWMGVGGQAVDMSGAPVTGLIIRLGGKLPGVNIPEHLMSLTGVALSYGRAGYEFTLADRPIASRGLLWIQLLDQAGVPLSDKIFFDTYDSCDKALIIINFKQVRER